MPALLSSSSELDVHEIKARNRKLRTATAWLIKIGWLPAFISGSIEYTYDSHRSMLMAIGLFASVYAFLVIVGLALLAFVKKIPKSAEPER